MKYHYKIIIYLVIAFSFQVKTIALMNLFNDPTFNNGFTVLAPALEDKIVPGEYRYINGIRCPLVVNKSSGNKHQLYFNNKKTKNNPSWSIAQWGSRANLLPSHGKAFSRGAFKWENFYKTFINGKAGSGYRYLTLGVRGDREHRGQWSYERDPCVENRHPHLYVGQVPKKVTLGSMKKLELFVGAKVTRDYITAARRKDWNKSLATSHFVVQINIQNIRADKDRAKGHADSFGLGINLFDTRNGKYYDERVFIHKPQERLILYVNPNHLGANVTKRLHNKSWATIKKDILPHIKRALTKAISESKKENSFVKDIYSKNLNDYIITSVNFGWEVSSLHEAEMQISEFRLLYE